MAEWCTDLLADLWHAESIGDCALYLHLGRRAVAHGFGHARCVLRLNADNHNVWAMRLDGEGNACNEASSSDWDDDGLDERELLEDLDANSACACDDRGTANASTAGEGLRMESWC